MPSTPTTILVASTTRPNQQITGPGQGGPQPPPSARQVDRPPSSKIPSSDLIPRLLLAVDGGYPEAVRQPRHGRAPAHSPPCGVTAHGGPAVHAAATDSRPSPGVVRWWSFRAQLPVRAAVAPERASSAQTPPARPFSQPASFPRQVPMAYGVSAPPGPVTVRAPLPPFTSECGMSRSPCGSGSRQAATFRSDRMVGHDPVS